MGGYNHLEMYVYVEVGCISINGDGKEGCC